MHIVLGLGTLYIRSRPVTDDDRECNHLDHLIVGKGSSSCIITSAFQNQNISLLLTCHQAFLDGHGIHKSLHAQATFVCPTGPLEDTQANIKSLKPGDLTSVRFASIHMSTADLGTPVYQELVKRVENPIDIENGRLTEDAWIVLTDIMRHHWHGKLFLIKESFPALEVLHSVKEGLHLRKMNRLHSAYPQPAILLEGAAGAARTVLADLVSENGDSAECYLIKHGNWGWYLEFDEMTNVDPTLRENAGKIFKELTAQLPKLREI